MEVIAVIMIAVIVLVAVVTSDRPHNQPSFIITPMTEDIRHRGSDGCLILAMLGLTIVFVMAINL